MSGSTAVSVCLGAVCFSWHHHLTSPHLTSAVVQPWSSPHSRASQHRSITATVIVKCRDIGGGAHSCQTVCLAVAGQLVAGESIQPFWTQQLSLLACRAAHLRGGLTPPAGHPLGTSSLLVVLLLACRWGEDPWSPSVQLLVASQRSAVSLARLWYPSVPESRVQHCAAC